MTGSGMTRKVLEETLARAEAYLQNAVKVLASGHGDASAASEKVDKARANCRVARAALSKQDRTDG